ncbi:MAG: UDP-N-acetylmuramate--L-alanine ligase [Clostridia bacterium]
MERFKMEDIAPNSHIHFIGIGGISMSGLAQIVLKNGYKVSGSDWNKSEITEKLESIGANIVYGRDAVNTEGIANASLVVYTAAAKADNPEIIAAKEKSVRLIDRAEFLGAIMKGYTHAVGVSGTHGKTTTTSMLAHAMIYADLDPTISVGGELDLIGGNIKTGSSDYFVTEACEYTNSFLKFYPTIALITNIEEDHLDFFSGIDEIIESFRQFAMLTKDTGKVVALGSDENIQKALKDTNLDITTYGMSDAYDYYPMNIKYHAGFPSFDVYNNGNKLCSVRLNVPGEHNILNALATIAVCCIAGIEPQTAAEGIETFKGTHRRFEKKGFVNGAVIIDDYAHHPTEIKATLKAAKEFDRNRVICIFQPHTYSRTRTLWNEFKEAFDDADELILTHIYAAREKFDGVTKPEDLAEQIKERGINAKFIDDFEDIVKYVKETAAAGDIIFTMGAGDVTEIGPKLAE